MRIADYIAKQRRDVGRLNRVLGIVVMILFVPFAIMASQLHQAEVLWLIGPIIIATMVVMGRAIWSIKCPQCHAVLGYPTGPGRRQRFRQPAETHCPKCGLDFDRPMPGKSI
jgi:hypothetical protein